MLVQILKCQSQLQTVAALSPAIDFNRGTAVDTTLVSLIIYGVFVAFRPNRIRGTLLKPLKGISFHQNANMKQQKNCIFPPCFTTAEYSGAFKHGISLDLSLFWLKCLGMNHSQGFTDTYTVSHFANTPTGSIQIKRMTFEIATASTEMHCQCQSMAIRQ